ncbi:hypothetical protein [Fusobacterium sp. PH5-44]|uniref:hypothetical protein n=1 Tax=unclassified Fusobacterium TaxID=2648384 RepID=UPI003D21F37E
MQKKDNPTIKTLQKNLTIKSLKDFREKKEIHYFGKLQEMILDGRASSYKTKSADKGDF